MSNHNDNQKPSSLCEAYGTDAAFIRTEAGWSDPHGILTIG